MANSWQEKKNSRPRHQPGGYLSGRQGMASLNATKHAIILTFKSILVKGKVHFCRPRPDIILELLKKYHNIKIGRRWFFACMSDIENSNLMRRTRRWTKSEDNSIKSNPSMWVFTFRGMQYLKTKLISGAQEIAKLTIDWMHRNDKRFPQPSNIFPTEERTEQVEALAMLQDLIKDIG